MGNDNQKVVRYGYRIIKITPHSPAQMAGCQEFLDFIIDIESSIEKDAMTSNISDFLSILSRNENMEINLTIHNILYRKSRKLKLIPNRDWPNADSLLGVLIRYEEYTDAHARVLRVASVKPNSPAMISGLVPEDDYILGSPQYLYKDINDFQHFIELTQESAIKSLEICAYNSKTGKVRSVLVLPNKNWGGVGYLGCEFALGIINVLPYVDETEQELEMHADEVIVTNTEYSTSKEETFDFHLPDPDTKMIKDMEDEYIEQMSTGMDILRHAVSNDNIMDTDHKLDEPRLQKNSRSMIVHRGMSSPLHSFSPKIVHSQRMKYILEKREKKTGDSEGNTPNKSSSKKSKNGSNHYDFHDNKFHIKLPQKDDSTLNKTPSVDCSELESIQDKTQEESKLETPCVYESNCIKNEITDVVNIPLQFETKKETKVEIQFLNEPNNVEDNKKDVIDILLQPKPEEESKVDSSLLDAPDHNEGQIKDTMNESSQNVPLKEELNDNEPCSVKSNEVTYENQKNKLTEENHITEQLQNEKIDSIEENHIAEQLQSEKVYSHDVNNNNQESQPSIEKSQEVPLNQTKVNIHNENIGADSEHNKSIIKYNFFNKKLNRDYIISSDDLFDLDNFKYF